MLVVIALFFLGGEVLNTFALTLIIGIIIGTYSSIYVAAAIVVIWNDWKKRRKLAVVPAPARVEPPPAQPVAPRARRSRRGAMSRRSRKAANAEESKPSLALVSRFTPRRLDPSSACTLRAVIHFEEILEKVEAYNPQFGPGAPAPGLRVLGASSTRGRSAGRASPTSSTRSTSPRSWPTSRPTTSRSSSGSSTTSSRTPSRPRQAIAQQFGDEVAELVDGLTKIGKFSYVSREEEQAETFRKMLLAMISDLRVVLVKLADRLHNMRTLGFLPEAKRREIARETLDIYAPIAHRLGMGSVKGELEDLAFLYLEPEAHERAVPRSRPADEGLRGHDRGHPRGASRRASRTPASRPRSRAG